MKKLTTIALGTVLLSSSFTAHADNKWNDANNPKNFESTYQYNFYNLPQTGSIESQGKGWSDSYWPATRGYILDRWQQPSAAFQFRDYVLPSAAQIPTMTEAQLNLLSPAEKFDIIRGRYDLPLAKDLKKDKPSPKDWWKGLCNGWTRASLAFTEPKAIRFTSPITGQVVPLASADVKGLMAYYFSNIDQGHADFIGSANRGLRHIFDFGGGASKDVNPGAFHVVLTNEIGLLKRGFAMDRDPTPETWNQPYTGFETHVISEGPPSKGHSDGTAKEVTVSTTVTFVNELYNTTDEKLEDDEHVAPSVDALGIGNQHLKTQTYVYTLELNAYNQIIGGTWSTGDHPDLIWRQVMDADHISTFSANYYKDKKNDWTVLAEIIRQATAP